MANFLDYDKIKIGDVATLEKLITEEDVKKFVQLTGDDNPLHVNRSYAEKTPFKGIVVHGMLGASFLSTLIGTKLPGEGALWISQSFDFLKPVRLGDKLLIKSEVIKKFDKEKIIELATTIENQSKAVVLSGTGKVKLLEVRKDLTEKKITKEDPKVAIVTGATGGIGAAICRRLASEGFKIAINYRSDPEKAEALAEEVSALGGEALLVRGDLSNPADLCQIVRQTVSRFSTVSVLINNASPRINSCPLSKLEWGEFQEQIDVQLKAPFELIKACSPIMKELGQGSIVNISTQAIEGLPTAGWSAYSTAKAGLANLTRYAALELGPMGVRVNQVSPGMVDTALVGDIPEKSRLMIARQTPLRRLADPEDIANVIAFLVSKEGSYITGETIRVNGGMVMV